MVIASGSEEAFFMPLVDTHLGHGFCVVIPVSRTHFA
jgi:hypothetical protein